MDNIFTAIPAPLPKHGSPADRGSADAYYWRPAEPHYWPDGTGNGYKVPEAEMTDEQVIEYMEAYDSQIDRKDWG